jgi:hypothetical protein
MKQLLDFLKANYVGLLFALLTFIIESEGLLEGFLSVEIANIVRITGAFVLAKIYTPKFKIEKL